MGVGRGRLSADALTAVSVPLPAAVAHDAEQVKHGARGVWVFGGVLGVWKGEGGEKVRRREKEKRKKESKNENELESSIILLLSCLTVQVVFF